MGLLVSSLRHFRAVYVSTNPKFVHNDPSEVYRLESVHLS